MQCQRCGKDLGNSMRCNFCGFNNSEGHVREMSRMEKNYYDGITIDAEQNEDTHSREDYRSNYGGYTRTARGTFINVSEQGFFSRLLTKLIEGLLHNSLWAKIVAGIIAVVFAAVMFFVALPLLGVFFVIAAVFVAVTMFKARRRRF